MNPDMFLQASSQYCFEKSKRKYLVSDLLDLSEKKRNGTWKYILADPVIHKNKRKSRKGNDFGQTDRGQKEMRAFLRLTDVLTPADCWL